MSGLVKEVMRVATSDGKYEVVQYEDGVISSYRNGTGWLPRINELEMAKLVLQLAYDLEEARRQITELHKDQSRMTS